MHLDVSIMRVISTLTYALIIHNLLTLLEDVQTMQPSAKEHVEILRLFDI